MTDAVLERELVVPSPRRGSDDPLGRRRTPGWLPLAGAAVLILAAAPLVLWICATAHPHPMVHAVGLFFHLAALVVGFGSVLSVDWVALLFMLGRRDFKDLLASAENASVPIWLGYAGLVLSGLVLEPDLHSTITQIKLGLVLVVGLNGLVAVGLHQSLHRRGEMGPMALGMVCATVSQVGWWGATVVGFINAH